MSYQTVILCGGKGTRIREVAEELPKALVPVGNRPIIWHILRIYALQGFTDHVLCIGYKGYQLIEYFSEQPGAEIIKQDSTATQLKLDIEGVAVHVTLVDTGEDSQTGGRVLRAKPYITGDDFFVTYGDGLSNVDLSELKKYYEEKQCKAVLTAVRPELQFGVLRVDGFEMVKEFYEKPRLQDWINGGFFVFNKTIFELLDGDDCILERGPLEHLAITSELAAYKHPGFWQCMDTFKDYVQLNELWETGKTPWYQA